MLKDQTLEKKNFINYSYLLFPAGDKRPTSIKRLYAKRNM